MTFNLGQTATVGDFTDSGNSTAIPGFQITLPVTASLISLTFRVTTVAGQLNLGLYAESAGAPGARLAQTGLFTPSTGANVKPLSLVNLAPGNYWLVHSPTSDGLNYPGFNTGGNCAFGTVTTGTGNLPNPYGTVASTNTFLWSFFGTFDTPNNPPARPLIPGRFNRLKPPFWPPAREASLSSVSVNAIVNHTLVADSVTFSFAGTDTGLSRNIVQGQQSPSPPLFGELNRKVPPFWPPARETALSTQGASRNNSLSAAQGSFAFTGFANGFSVGHALSAAQGAFAITGEPVTGARGKALVAAQGAFTFTGETVTMPRGHTISAAQGSFAFTGQAVTFVKGKSLTATQGSFAITGEPAAFARGKTLTAGQGAYAFTGFADSFSVGRTLAAGQGAFLFTGQPVTLTPFHISIGAAIAQPLVPGRFNRLKPPFWPPSREASLSTQNQIPIKTLLAGVGAFGFTGQSVTLSRGHTVQPAQGAFAFTGEPTSLGRGRAATAAQGAFAITGSTAGLGRGKTLSGAQGAFAYTGQPASLKRARFLTAGNGTFVFTGIVATLSAQSAHNKTLTAATGFFGFAGQVASFVVVQLGQGGTASAKVRIQQASASISRMAFLGTGYRASCVFTDFTKVLADPTLVVFTFDETDHTPIRDSLGNYHFDLVPARAGRLLWRWTGSGGVNAVTAGFVEVT